MNLQENIQRIKEVMNLHESNQPMKIYVDMGGVLFPSGSNDQVQQGTTERPKDVKGFQSWVINTKGDNQILGKYGNDGKWGKNTSNAWLKYGEEYKQTTPNSITQDSGNSNFIGAKLWNGLKQHDPTILSSVGSTNPKQKIKNKLNQITNVLGLPNDRAIFVTSGKDKANYANGNILIDDSPENINAWKAAGGIGILHKNSQSTLDELSGYLNR
jgi:hypothetical protein